MDAAPHDDEQRVRAPRWDHDPLEESLHDARLLTTSVVDRTVRDGWTQLAAIAGVPRRRMRRFAPLRDGESAVALVDGQPALDTAAWERFVSLVPGAVALPTRTAASFGVARSALRPPDRRLRVADLLAARRRRRRLRRAVVTLDAEHARYRARIETMCDEALDPGEDGTPLQRLPSYALAARVERLLAASANESLPVLVDLLAIEATTLLVQALRTRGREPGPALLEAAQLQSGGGAAVAPHLQALATAALSDGAQRARALAAWREGIDGWFAMRELVLEAQPLRACSDEELLGLAAASSTPAGHERTSGDGDLADDEDIVRAALRARTVVAMREAVARDRARVHAALRALVVVLADGLAREQRLATPEAAFDLHLVDLLRIARGVDADGLGAPALPDDARTIAAQARDDAATVVSLGPVELRGIPASTGVVSGAVVVVEGDPSPGIDVDGRVLVCRVTDPAWLPLMQRCTALVTERGGPLSHAAIVARELGLPTVVGVRGALDAARRAGSARVDGAAGTVVFQPRRAST